jgi:ATP-dependent Clp protease protease subunit
MIMNLESRAKAQTDLRFHDMLMKELEWGINTDTNTIYLSGDIGGETLHSTAMSLDTMLRFNPDSDVTLNLNSFGGDTYAMFGLIDKMRSLDVNVNTTCMGVCMSAAAVILASGTGKRMAHKHSTIMVHDGQIGIQEKTADFMRASDHFKELTERCNKLMSEVSKKDFDYWGNVNKFDSYFTAEQALEVGLVDEIIDLGYGG